MFRLNTKSFNSILSNFDKLIKLCFLNFFKSYTLGTETLCLYKNQNYVINKALQCTLYIIKKNK